MGACVSTRSAPATVPSRTYDVVPHAQALDYDDSDRAGSRRSTPAAVFPGRVCSPGTYRVTIPEHIGDLDTGVIVVFEVAIDDYAEVWSTARCRSRRR